MIVWERWHTDSSREMIKTNNNNIYKICGTEFISDLNACSVVNAVLLLSLLLLTLGEIVKYAF